MDKRQNPCPSLKEPFREVARGYLISLRASRYSPRYIQAMEMTLRLLADYAEAEGWPDIGGVTASHIGEYLVYLQQRPRWLGKRDRQERPVSASSIDTHYRRIKTFFRWLVERGHVATNPLDLLQHPRFEERVIPTVAEEQMLDLLELVEPRHARTEAERFRAYRNRAIILLLIDTPIRRGEVAGLWGEDVDLDTGMVKGACLAALSYTLTLSKNSG